MGRLFVGCVALAEASELPCCARPACFDVLCFAFLVPGPCCAECEPHHAELFTWASGREITKEQAMRCAKREPGRSWEAIEPELTRLGNPTPKKISVPLPQVSEPCTPETACHCSNTQALRGTEPPRGVCRGRLVNQHLAAAAVQGGAGAGAEGAGQPAADWGRVVQAPWP